MNIIGSTAAQAGRTPGSPTNVSAVAGNASAVVSFTPPSYTGKSTIMYTAVSSPGGISGSSNSSPITVTGLSNGTSYTFTVLAASSN